MRFKALCLTIIAASLIACGGGGGGGSRTAPAPSPDEDANPIPTDDGSTNGGTDTSDGTASDGGLIGGSAKVVVVNDGTSGTLDVSFGGTGLRGIAFTSGDIQRFSSVVANDIVSTTDNAQFINEGTPASQSDLKQGQQVLIINDENDDAVAVVYRANIKGPVTEFQLIDPALGRSDMTVLGQNVITNGATTFSNLNLTDFDTAAVGSLLEISGVLDSAGTIHASFIELKSSLSRYKVTGVAINVTTTALTIGGLIVDIASASLSDFDSNSVTEGDVVEVRGIPVDFNGSDQLVAEAVERLPDLVVGTTTLVRIEGIIDDFTSTNEFTVQTTPISTDGSTTFVNGGIESLGLGVKVQIRGTAGSDGTILASLITIQPTNTIRAEGNIEALEPDQISVLGVAFEVRDLTRFEDDSSAGLDPFSFNQLAIGDRVELRGYLDGSSFVATQVEREDTDDRARLRGIVTAIDATAGTLVLNGVTIQADENTTQFELANDSLTNQDAFFNAIEIGSFVRATWDVFTSTDQTVDELSIEDD